MDKSTQRPTVIHLANERRFSDRPTDGRCGIDWCQFAQHGAPDEDDLYWHLSAYRDVDGVGKFALLARTSDPRATEPRNLVVVTPQGLRSLAEAFAAACSHKNALESLLCTATAKFLPPDQLIDLPEGSLTMVRAELNATLHLVHD